MGQRKKNNLKEELWKFVFRYADDPLFVSSRISINPLQPQFRACVNRQYTELRFVPKAQLSKLTQKLLLLLLSQQLLLFKSEKSTFNSPYVTYTLKTQAQKMRKIAIPFYSPPACTCLQTWGVCSKHYTVVFSTYFETTSLWV